MKVSQIISENTGISIGLVITLVGGIFWLSTIYFQGKANASAIEAIYQERGERRVEYLDTMKSLDDTLKEMNTRLSRIEGAVVKQR